MGKLRAERGKRRGKRGIRGEEFNKITKYVRLQVPIDEDDVAVVAAGCGC
jgi:hypothetical protein